MEKAFIWNPVYRRLPDTERTVIIQCDILDDPTLGFFDTTTREWHILDSELNKEKGVILNVIAWMEMPTRYIERDNLEFRSAAEARYFMTISSSRDMSAETISFYKIRRAIRSAAERGMGFCRIQIGDITDNLAEKLKNGGYSLEKKGEYVIISWV